VDRLKADRYRIERELGRGGMATVYLARDLKHDRSVALKVMHPDLGLGAGTERFLREIRTTARHMCAQSPGHTLQVTGLVHEAFLRLVDQEVVEWQGHAQFFGVAGKAMRSILVDHARARAAAKRGGGAKHLTLGPQTKRPARPTRWTCSLWTRR
jgi:hypothetical protein